MTARRRPALATLLACAVLLVLWHQAGRWYRARLIAEQRDQEAVAAGLYAHALSLAIQEQTGRCRELGAYVQANPSDPAFEQRFHLYASALHAGSKGVRSLFITRNGTVTHVHPGMGNESIIGYRPAEDERPAMRLVVERALAGQDLALSPPLPLPRGAVGIVAYQAVGWTGGDRILAGIMLDVTALLDDIGLRSDGAFEAALRSPGGDVLWGPADVFARSPVIATVPLPEGEWELGYVPAAGWQPARTHTLAFDLSGLAVVALGIGLTYLTASRQQALVDAVARRTAEIERMNASLRESHELLEVRVAARTSELSTLLEISNDIAATLELEPLLARLLPHLRTMIAFEAATIALRDGDDHLSLLLYRGPVDPPPLPPCWAITTSAPALGADVILGARTVLIADTLAADDPAAGRHRRAWAALTADAPLYARTWLGLPLVARDRAIGLLALEHRDPHAYDAHHAALAATFANQAAVAIDNARLYAQERRIAGLEERQRLARELHDSVSQALYGISLGAQTARRLLPPAADAAGPASPEQLQAALARLAEPLDYVQSLTRAAIAEMRALILELRPDALTGEGLVAALSRQAEATAMRHGLQVHQALGEEPVADIEAKEALYRIAQEALANVVRHAQAREVWLELHSEAEGLRLVVRDDGVGFDSAQPHPGHLGLRSMAERARAVGGTLELTTAPGAGTTAVAVVPRG